MAQQNFVAFMHWLQDNHPDLYTACYEFIEPDSRLINPAVIKEGLTGDLYGAIHKAMFEYGRQGLS